MKILYSLSGLFAKIHSATKFFVVASDVFRYASEKFEEAYPQSQKPQSEPAEIVEDAK